MKLAAQLLCVLAVVAMVLSLTACGESPFCKNFDSIYKPVTTVAYLWFDRQLKDHPDAKWAPSYASLKVDLDHTATDIKAQCALPTVDLAVVGRLVAHGAALIADVWSLYGSLQDPAAKGKPFDWQGERDKAQALAEEAAKG